MDTPKNSRAPPIPDIRAHRASRRAAFFGENTFRTERVFGRSLKWEEGMVFDSNHNRPKVPSFNISMEGLQSPEIFSPQRTEDKKIKIKQQ